MFVGADWHGRPDEWRHIIIKRRNIYIISFKGEAVILPSMAKGQQRSF